jgi:hypothetical protein
MRISIHRMSGVTPFPSSAGVSPASLFGAFTATNCRPFLRHDEQDAGATKCRKAERKLW